MKKSILFLLTLGFFVFVSNIASAQSVVQNGKFRFDPTLPNYSLANIGGHEKTQPLTITFPKPFKTIPQVIVSITTYDGDKSENTRYQVNIVSITKSTVQLEAKSWGGSRIYAIAGQWLAIGD
jgi:hypothetical protein